MGTLAGAGLIRAVGGVGDSFSSSHGGHGGGGRIAVLARNSDGFDTRRITAPGGPSGGPYSDQRGGAGTVYLRDTDEPSGTLIIDVAGGGDGVTPLGLPGQGTWTVPDAVVVRGIGTRVRPEHAGLTLEFQGPLRILQGGRLEVAADGFVAHQAVAIDGGTLAVAGAFAPDWAVAVNGGGTLDVTGSMTPEVSLAVTGGGRVVVSGELSLDVPLTLDGGSLEAESVSSTLPLTVRAGRLTTDLLVSPGLTLSTGGVLTSLTTTADRVHTLEAVVAETIAVDATSAIDVSGKGYLPGYTTGNSTAGGAGGLTGGSYGGRGGGGRDAAGASRTANTLYGDAPDPDEPGAGGGLVAERGGPGGGLVRLRATALQLDGVIVADGLPRPGDGAGGGGSGGAVVVEVGTLSGTGLIRAAGAGGTSFNNGNTFGFGGGGGGGRIAVYAAAMVGFDPARVTSPGGPGTGNGGEDGGAGTVHIAQGGLHTHVRSHSPYGQDIGYVDYGNGYVSHAIDSITLKFNQAIDLTSFDPSTFEITGQMGRVRPTGMTEVGDRTYRIDLPFALSENGLYHFTLFPTLRDVEGVPLDQDADGTPGEAEDVYAFTLVVDTVAPRTSQHAPAGDIAGTIDHVDVWFSETIEASTFTTSDLTVTRPDGQAVGPSGIQNIGLNRFRIFFAPQTLAGTYHVMVGPQITDLAGNLLDQNRDGKFGQVDDVYDAGFNLIPVDLGLGSLVVSTSTLVAGEEVTVSWQGKNQTGVPLLGDWADAVYLSSDGVWDINDVLLGTVPHTGGLMQDEVYPGSLTALVPGVLPGNYHVLVRADIANQERETNEANNLLASAPIPLQVHSLPSTGVPLGGTLTPSDRADYYAIHVNGGESLGLFLDGLAASGVDELYANFEAIPTRLAYDYRSLKDETFFDRQDQQLGFTAPPGGGTFYVLVYGSEIEGSSAYNISATTGEFVVTSITPDRSTNRRPDPAFGTSRPTGRVIPTTVTVTGAGFGDSTTVDFIAADGSIFTPTSTHIVATTTLTLNLDVTTWPAGPYDVRIRKGATSFTKQHAFTIVQGGTPELETKLIVPGAVASRARTPETIWIEYRNTGDVPMPAPLLKLTASSTQNARITADRDLAYPFTGYQDLSSTISDTVQVMATGSGATPGILQPGDSGRIPVYYLGLDESGHVPVTFTLSELTADDVSWEYTVTSSGVVEVPPGSGHKVIVNSTRTTGEDWHVDWSSAATRPESVPLDAWNAVTSNLNAMVGTEWGYYVEALADDANFLHALGQDTQDIRTLYGFEVAQASASLNPVSYLAGSVDASVPAPGLPLSFSRVYGQPIVSRYKLGPLGRGWSTNWDVRAEVQSNGDVVLRGPGGVDRFFTKQPDGSYKPSLGDFASLTSTANGFKLTETDQTVWQFHADGKLDFVQDSNANRITLGYDPVGRLVTLTHSNGSQLRLEYNAAGRIARVIDPLGPGTADDLVTTYEYDTSGEHLMRVTEPGNRVTDYAYDSSSKPARTHALLEVAYPDGTHDHFAYDDLGRLVETSADGDAQRLTFTYDTAGGVTVTDATGRTTFLAYGLDGRLEQVRDGDGRVVDFVPSSSGQLHALIGPGGDRYDYDYDPRGNLTGIRDPLRQRVTFTYDTNFNQITSVTDARGNGMTYGYDTRGNLISITYADGTHENYSYDASGNILTATNRRGERVTYTYSAAGQVTSKDYPGTPGIDFVYAYDTAGNLVSATDPGGTTTMAYDPATNLLTRIDYPGGLFFTFQYDTAGRRTKRTDQDGHIESSTYDAVGRLDTMHDEHGAPIVDYDYDAAGRVSKKTLGNGVFTTYDYDASGNILHLINQRADGSILSRFDYTYDTTGRRTSMTTLDGTQNYGYDPLGQLISVAYPDGHVVTYTYDAAGNRIQVDDNGSLTSYTTNSLNQYTTVGGAVYTYDADGNTKTKTENGVATTYTYDVENRLIAVSTPTDAWVYAYDALGNRIASTHNGVVTKYVIDPAGLGNVAAEYNISGGLIARYDHGYGLLSRTDAMGSPDYYTFSAIGNTSELTDPTGVVLNSYSFNPFGVPLSQAETVSNLFKYVGEYGIMEDGNGLDFMRARYYEPGTGHFTQADPLGLLGGVNAYSYTHNSPTYLIDPRGTRDNFWGDILNGLYGDPNSWGRNGGPGGYLLKQAYDMIHNPYKLGRDGGDPYDYLLELIGLLPAETGAVTDFIEGLAPELKDRLNGDKPHSNDGVSGGASGRGGANGRGGGSPPPTQSPLSPSGHDTNISKFTSHTIDPNDKLAPGGFGDAAYISSDDTLSYQVHFENKPDATAPAQEITITDTLDADLDLNTLQVTDIVFADQSIAVPVGLDHYETTVPFTANGQAILVDVRAGLDRATRMLTLNLRAIDPATGWFPEDPLIGLLYPNDDAGRGMGSFSYLIKPKTGLPSGTAIENRARIIFDLNDPIDTPLVHNTLDSAAPTSNVSPLPMTATDTTIHLEWSCPSGSRAKK